MTQIIKFGSQSIDFRPKAKMQIVDFDDPLPIDSVTFAIVPVDRYTGAIVRGGVTAEIPVLKKKAHRNLSGLLVFVNLEEQIGYEFEIKAGAAGFFDVNGKIARPADDALDIDRLETIELDPLPTASFTNETTLVRGVVHHEGEPVGRAMIGAVVEPDLGQPMDQLPYLTQSDRRGAFVLPLRVPDQTPGASGVPNAEFWFHFGKSGLPERKLKRKVTDGSQYRFGLPIDLADDGSLASQVLIPGNN